MAKCIRCGKSLLLSKVKLADAEICGKCFDELGFKEYRTVSTLYKYDDIKNGYEEYQNIKNRQYWEQQDRADAAEFGVSPLQATQLRRISATDMEKKILGAIDSVLFDEDCDANLLEAALGHNGSVMLMLEGTVIIEYKADAGVKWIRFLNESEDKIKIGGPARMNALGSRIAKAYKSAE